MTSVQLPRRIVLMLDYMGPGDALRISSCLGAVRAAYPTATITLLTHESVYPLFVNSSLVDRIVASRLYRPTKRQSALRHARRLIELGRLVRILGVHSDLVIVFGWGTTTLNVLAWLVGRRRFGYAHRFPGLLSRHIGYFVARSDEVEQNQKLLLVAGIHPPSYSVPLRIDGSRDNSAVDELLAEHGITVSDRLVLLHPGSDWACQQWLQERWAQLADHLVASYGATVVFTGLANESAYIDSIREQMRLESVSLTGRTSLPQLGALMARVRLCVCVDTIAYELAQAAGVPTVLLAGPSSPHVFDSARRRPAIVNRTGTTLRDAINDCREPKFVAERSCLNYECPMAGLRSISVQDVVTAILAREDVLVAS